MSSIEAVRFFFSYQSFRTYTLIAALNHDPLDLI
jgi:hypothetical protein